MTTHKEPLVPGMKYERVDTLVVMRCTRCDAAWHVEGLKPSAIRYIAKAHDTARHASDG